MNVLSTTDKFRFEYYDKFIEQKTRAAHAGFLLLVRTFEPLEGRGIPQILLQQTLKHYRSLGYRYVYGIGRYSSLESTYRGINSGMRHVHDYFRRTRADGYHPDHTVRFHQKAGGKVLCALPACAHDADSANSGFLVIYDLQDLSL